MLRKFVYEGFLSSPGEGVCSIIISWCERIAAQPPYMLKNDNIDKIKITDGKRLMLMP